MELSGVSERLEKLEATLVDVTSHVTNLLRHAEKMEARLFGNGRAGLVERLTSLEEAVRLVDKRMGGPAGPKAKSIRGQLIGAPPHVWKAMTVAVVALAVALVLVTVNWSPSEIAAAVIQLRKGWG